MHPFLQFAKENQGGVLQLVRELVECESPSDSPEHVNRVLDVLTEHTRDIATAEILDLPQSGKALKLTFDWGGGHGQILALGHADTVWPLGTIERMPFRQEAGRLWGPGVLDMKAGLAIFVFAIRALMADRVRPERRVCLLVVPDEETGSTHSRSLTETEARGSEAVLVLEPGTGLDGKLKTARKGVGHYTVLVEGKPAHAGVDFESGVSAIVDAARLVLRMSELTDVQRGLTVNPGMIHGGTRSNVIAAEARIEVDVRVPTLADAQFIDEEMRALQARDARCRVRVEGGLNRPPMERTDSIIKLFRKAEYVARQLGIELHESSTGGGSDGNFTAALGVPTLDGLGAVGEGAHAEHESVLVDRIADRVALIAGLLTML
jgi:glutamate carboxypeptidase